MSDLISRSALIENIKDTIGNDARVITIANAFVNIVQQQPIAYDLDAVVEELKKQWNNAICIDDDMFYLGIANGLADAIDIVRKGGVNR